MMLSQRNQRKKFIQCVYLYKIIKQTKPTYSSRNQDSDFPLRKKTVNETDMIPPYRAHSQVEKGNLSIPNKK